MRENMIVQVARVCVCVHKCVHTDVQIYWSGVSCPCKSFILLFTSFLLFSHHMFFVTLCYFFRLSFCWL